MLFLVGFGGNLPETPLALLGAVQALAARWHLVATSRVWKTPAMGPPQGDFLNATAVVDVHAHPTVLLDHCQRIEAQAGRDRRREQRWGPRVLDLDLLLAPELILQHPRLTLPHPHLHTRPFMLLPACEVAPQWRHPRFGFTLAELLTPLDCSGCAPVQLPGWPT